VLPGQLLKTAEIKWRKRVLHFKRRIWWEPTRRNALREENLSEHERDVIWNQEAESIEIEAESDELDLPTN
jgi:hypothetical protein